MGANGTPAGSIDFAAIRQAVDLKRFVQDTLGPPLKGGRWKCPVHGGEGPNFAVRGQHWKCWTCGAAGDVFDFLARVEKITVAEAAARLDPSLLYRRPARKAPSGPAERPAPARPTETRTPAAGRPGAAAWDDPEWQRAVGRIVCDAEETLWGPTGVAARGWLRARGLDAATVRRFRLGFVPERFATDPIPVLGMRDTGEYRRLWVPRGITIPWVHPAGWYDMPAAAGPRWVGLNVRRLAADVNAPLPGRVAKYQTLGGSERGHGYPWGESTMPGEPAIVAEGEFDALVAWQETGWVANVVTFGGAGQASLRDDARAFLATCPDRLLLFDLDPAGDDAAGKFYRKDPDRCRRLYLPDGCNDLTDLHRSGASVLGWLRGEWARVGWPWPLRTPTPNPNLDTGGTP
jgi:DNA primase